MRSLVIAIEVQRSRSEAQRTAPDAEESPARGGERCRSERRRRFVRCCCWAGDLALLLLVRAVLHSALRSLLNSLLLAALLPPLCSFLTSHCGRCSRGRVGGGEEWRVVRSVERVSDARVQRREAAAIARRRRPIRVADEGCKRGVAASIAALTREQREWISCAHITRHNSGLKAAPGSDAEWRRGAQPRRSQRERGERTSDEERTSPNPAALIAPHPAPSPLAARPPRWPLLGLAHAPRALLCSRQNPPRLRSRWCLPPASVAHCCRGWEWTAEPQHATNTQHKVRTGAAAAAAAAVALDEVRARSSAHFALVCFACALRQSGPSICGCG